MPGRPAIQAAGNEPAIWKEPCEGLRLMLAPAERVVRELLLLVTFPATSVGAFVFEFAA